MNEIVRCVFLLATLGSVVAKPQIVSRPEFVTVYTGQAVMFRCQVYNPQNSLMSWSSVTHNFTISNGSRLLVADNTRYSIISIAGGQQYNLQILDVRKSDEGFYKCAIEGTDQELISQLRVLDMPTTLFPSRISSSFTSISPSSTETSPASTSISPSSTETSLASTSISPSSTSILDRPTKLAVIKADDGSTDLLLTWDMEQGTADTRFTVFYRTLSEVQYSVVSNIMTTYYLLTDLKPSTFYTVYIVAKRGDYTESLPSENMQFVSGYKTAANDKTDKTTVSDDENLLILGIAIGATVATVVLIVMILSVVCFIYRTTSCSFSPMSVAQSTNTLASFSDNPHISMGKLHPSTERRFRETNHDLRRARH